MRNQQGFSLLELVTVIAIISILVVVALKRMLPYIDEAERVSVIRLEGQLRSTLVMEAAKRIVRGESATITDLNGSNPVQFLLEPPKNYVGEVNAGTLQDVGPRHWYFDSGRRELVYRLGQAFVPIAGDEHRENPAFSVRVAYSDRDGDGRFEASRDELYGVRLVRVAGGSWLAGAAAN
jgi:prepilin-type N-terminal cleavage/methylation domain-containing protein